MPLDWNDFNDPPERWTVLTVPQRLRRLRADPWKDYWHLVQIISGVSFAAVTQMSR